MVEKYRIIINNFDPESALGKIGQTPQCSLIQEPVEGKFLSFLNLTFLKF